MIKTIFKSGLLLSILFCSLNASIAQIINGKIVYELAENQHHHLICHQCGKTIQVEHAPFKTLYRQLESSTGYKLDSSHVPSLACVPIVNHKT